MHVAIRCDGTLFGACKNCSSNGGLASGTFNLSPLATPLALFKLRHLFIQLLFELLASAIYIVLSLTVETVEYCFTSRTGATNVQGYSLHWLPVEQCRRVHDGGDHDQSPTPQHLSRHSQTRNYTQDLRSSASPLMSVRCSTTAIAGRGFCHSTPSVWNSISRRLGQYSIASYCQLLKLHL